MHVLQSATNFTHILMPAHLRNTAFVTGVAVPTRTLVLLTILIDFEDGVEVACSVLPSERESAQLRVECTTRLHLDSAGSRIVSWISS